MVTGVDIVKEQLRIASGEPLSFSQDDIVVRGHAIECRINAETGPDFLPVTGTAAEVVFPGGPGIRVDSHLYSGYILPAHYDSLMAKIMAYGHDRDEAIDRMERALNETIIAGIPSTLPVLREIVSSRDFRRGAVHTDFIETREHHAA
jgi:acetyl-CoA carboxylase biotin carboxylase subunit